MFAAYFKRAWKTNRAPGQWAAPIQDVGRLSLPAFDRVAKSKGYDFVEAAVSHYHVAMWCKSRGYRFSYEKDAQTMAALAAGIKRVKDSGIPLTRTQESWLCVVQALRPVELIPEGLFLSGPTWPQDNIKPDLLWMNKAISEKGAQLITQPQ